MSFRLNSKSISQSTVIDRSIFQSAAEPFHCQFLCPSSSPMELANLSPITYSYGNGQPFSPHLRYWPAFSLHIWNWPAFLPFLLSPMDLASLFPNLWNWQALSLTYGIDQPFPLTYRISQVSPHLENWTAFLPSTMKLASLSPLTYGIEQPFNYNL